MAEFTFKIAPESSREAAHRVAVNNTFGAPIESFRYDPVTGIIRVTTRPFPAFGIVEAESEDSKLVQRLIKEYGDQNAVLMGRVKESDRREQELTQGEANLRQGENDLAKERAAFEREKKGLPPRGVIARARFVLGR